MFNSIQEARIELVRSVARFCAAAALTEPAVKGDLACGNNVPYVETKFLDDPQMLLRLADWMKEYGREHRQPIWLHEAALIERLEWLASSMGPRRCSTVAHAGLLPVLSLSRRPGSA